MSIFRISGISGARSLGACLMVFVLAACGCSKHSTDSTAPATSFGGHILLAGGQGGDVRQSQVQLYYGDPFAAGAAPYLTANATGSSTDATFSFAGLAAGDFYVVAWKDNGDGSVGKGDLLGWYDGARDGSAKPVAAVIHLLHGESRSVNIAMQALPVPRTTPAHDARSRSRAS
jgi:hypothetical protein